MNTVDGNGNVLTSTDAMSRVTTMTYDGFNEPLTIEDGNGVTTTNTYDTRGNLTSTARPLVGSTPPATQTTTYNHADVTHPGDVTSMVDPDGKTWTYGHDGHGYRDAVTDPLGDQTTTAYNADGWVMSSVSARGNVTGCWCATTYTTTYGHVIPGTGGTVLDQKDGKGDAVLTYGMTARAGSSRSPMRSATSPRPPMTVPATGSPNSIRYPGRPARERRSAARRSAMMPTTS